MTECEHTEIWADNWPDEFVKDKNGLYITNELVKGICADCEKEIELNLTITHSGDR